ncbi:hypothetical protein, partial [Burkholderia thailandensis]|uniref:hypothetical protein n=1 Tax=Burkholderia thailandensis TaxID=57975 RepID=UPI001E4825C8
MTPIIPGAVNGRSVEESGETGVFLGIGCGANGAVPEDFGARSGRQAAADSGKRETGSGKRARDGESRKKERGESNASSALAT